MRWPERGEEKGASFGVATRGKGETRVGEALLVATHANGTPLPAHSQPSQAPSYRRLRRATRGEVLCIRSAGITRRAPKLDATQSRSHLECHQRASVSLATASPSHRARSHDTTRVRTDHTPHRPPRIACRHSADHRTHHHTSHRGTCTYMHTRAAPLTCVCGFWGQAWAHIPR